MTQFPIILPHVLPAALAANQSRLVAPGAVLLTGSPLTEELLRIQEAGVGEDPQSLLPQFEEFRKLARIDRNRLNGLWREHDEAVREFRRSWMAHQEYLDPERPTLLGEELADFLQIPENRRAELVGLHYRLRSSLAGERETTVRMHTSHTYSVRFRLVDEPLPVRRGTVPVRLDAIDEVLTRFERSVRPFRNGERAELRSALTRVEIARGLQDVREWTWRFSGLKLVNRALRDVPNDKRYFIHFLHELFLRRLENLDGDALFENFSEEIRIWDLLHAVSERLGTHVEYLALHIFGPGIDKWKRRVDLKTEDFRKVLALLNVLSVREPWKILECLYARELAWAFGAPDQRTSRKFFEMDADEPVERLKTLGFGPMLTAARLERQWTLPSLAERVSARWGETVSETRMGEMGSNRIQPDFDLLAATVAALNEHPEAVPVDRAVAFLAAYPGWIPLLPLRARGGGDVLSHPNDPPFPFLPYAAPLDGSNLLISINRETVKRLDSDGLPALIQRHRGLMSLSVVKAAGRLGVNANYFRRMEKDPEEGRREIAGRLFMTLICSPDGLMVPKDRALEAHRSTYWSGNAVVDAIAARSFEGPVFVDEFGHNKLKRYARHPVRTPGEILYAWRNGLPSQGPSPEDATAGPPFLASEDQWCRFLKVNRTRYLRWEANLAVPSDAEIEALTKRLGRSESEMERLSEAALLSRRRLLDGGAHRPVPKWMKDYPALASFVALLAHRPLFREEGIKRVLRSLSSIHRKQRPSLRFLEEKTKNLTDASSDEVGRLIGVVQSVERRMRGLSGRVALRGPLAAYYYHQRGSREASSRLKFFLEDPKTIGIKFLEDGSCEVSRTRRKTATQSLSEDLSRHASVSRKDAAVLKALIESLKRRRVLVLAQESLRLGEALSLLASRDRASWNDFMKTLKEAPPEDWKKIRRALSSAVSFLERREGEIGWTGSVFGFFYANRGNRKDFMRFQNRLNRGGLKAVHFEDKNVTFEVLPPRNRRPPMRR